MATIIPAEPPAGLYDGERRTFAALARLPGDYTVLCDAGKVGEGGTRHQIDFVVMHPDHGFAVIEVKGGTVTLGTPQDYRTKWRSRRRDGQWVDIRNPYDQALGNRRVFLSVIKDSCPACRGFYRTEVAVILPETPHPGETAAVAALGDAREAFLFAEDLDSPETIDTRLRTLWAARRPQTARSRPKPPGPACIAQIPDAFSAPIPQNPPITVAAAADPAHVAVHLGAAPGMQTDPGTIAVNLGRPPSEHSPEPAPATPRRKSPVLGIVLAVLAVLFGLLGMFGPGLPFVPLTAIVAVAALVTAQWIPAVLGVALTVAGTMMSPSVLMMIAGISFLGLTDPPPFRALSARPAPSTAPRPMPPRPPERSTAPERPAPTARGAKPTPPPGTARLTPTVLGTDDGLGIVMLAYEPPAGRAAWCGVQAPIVAVIGDAPRAMPANGAFETAAAIAGFECPSANRFRLLAMTDAPATDAPGGLAVAAADAVRQGNGWRLEIAD